MRFVNKKKKKKKKTDTFHTAIVLNFVLYVIRFLIHLILLVTFNTDNIKALASIEFVVSNLL
jgi:quinol-cytochrome oxidoreductase complex cytochrome b subunit